MGLDMYVFKMSRLTKEELDAIKEVGRLEEDNRYLSISEDKIHESLYRDLEGYFEKVTVDNEYIDIDKVKKDNGIPEEAFVVGQSIGGGKISYSLSLGGGQNNFWNVELTREEIEESYLKTVRENVYLAKSELVGYWCQEEELNNTICNLYDDGVRYVENVGYYEVNTDMLKAMKDFKSAYGDGFKREIDNTEDLFYHIWF